MMDQRPLLSTGHFFPESPDSIDELFGGYGGGDGFPADLHPAALLLPHGTVALCGSALLPLMELLARDFPQRIMLIGSVHREYEDTLWLPPFGGFDTPYGPLSCETRLARMLAKDIPSSCISDIPFEEEACFDLILTALRYSGFTGGILPVLAGSSSPPLTEALKKLLRKLIAEEGYFPILTANYRSTSQLSPGTAAEVALCGEALFEGFRDYFSECAFRWYHGSDTGYSAGFWESPADKKVNS